MEGEERSIFQEAFRMTLPVMFGYIPIGIAFGLLVIHYGFHWTYPLLMSMIIYSGAGQFLAVALAVTGAGFAEIVLTMLFLNLRHSFFGLSLINRFANTGRIRPYLIFALTDETYALITGTGVFGGDYASKLYGWISGLNHAYWIIGSLAGALLGNLIDVDLKGLEFALTALFVVLSIEQYRTCKRKFPFIAAVAAGTIALVVAGARNMLLLSIIIGTLLLVVYEEVRDNDC